jgi:hypothetical protein
MLTEQPSGPNGTMTIRSFHVEAVQKRTGRDQFSNSYTLSISIAFIPLNSPHRFHSTITIFHSVNLKTNSVSTVFRFWITAESRQLVFKQCSPHPQPLPLPLLNIQCWTSTQTTGRSGIKP